MRVSDDDRLVSGHSLGVSHQKVFLVIASPPLSNNGDPFIKKCWISHSQCRFSVDGQHFVHCVFNDLLLWEDISQNHVADIVHVQRKAICPWVVEIGVLHNSPILSPYWICYSTGEAFR